MKTLDDFMPYVQPYAAACPQIVARQAVLDAAIEFCEKSGLLQYTLDPMSTVQGVYEYDLYLPTDRNLVQVKRAWFKGAEMTPVAVEAIRNPLAFRASVPGQQVQTGDPCEFYTAGYNQVGVYPRPRASESSALTVRASVKPSRSATQLEDELFEDWVEIIAAGALSRILATPGEAYTDVAKASARGMQFQEGVDKAKYRANFGRVRGELSVQMRPFA